MKFLTGVTKFGKVSVFSDLNNLNDISMDYRYMDICGITDKELQLRQRIKDTEWIVKSYSIIIEMITVILFFQLDVAFLFRQAVPFTQ